MDYSEVKAKFINFFAIRGHQLVPSASLIPGHDASVLLTVAGMQQFKPYFTGNISPDGEKLISIQKCFRTSDIDVVGDDTHLTFFEMFGNFAFNGAVTKEQAIKWAWDFLTDSKWMSISKSRIAALYYNGSRPGTKPDEISRSILSQLDNLTDISAQDEQDNFWGPTGNEGPCGPTVDFYVDGVEVWSLVFNEYYCSADGKLSLLENGLGVDTGMGLERLLVAATPEATNVYETDALWPIIEMIQQHTLGIDPDITRSMRIIADHLRGSVFLLSDHVQPSNKEQGYILRRLLRRAILHLDKLRILPVFAELIELIIHRYADSYPELLTEKDIILQLAILEKDKFIKTIAQGQKELMLVLDQVTASEIDGQTAFNLFATYGLPLDFIKEEAAKRNLQVDTVAFDKAFMEHQGISRAGVENKFGGHGLSSGTAVSSIDRQKITRLHTATHLLHAALIKFLGSDVRQAGSDLNTERARFDFTFPRALTATEKGDIQQWVNQQIKQDLPVKHETKSLTDALAEGATAFFKEKYPDQVEVYTIYNPADQTIISREICGGPHVDSTGEIGNFQIIKEQSSSAGVRRIKAIIE